MSAMPDETWREKLARWSDPEPQPCKWCDSEGVAHIIGGGIQLCDECGGSGVRDDGF